VRHTPSVGNRLSVQRHWGHSGLKPPRLHPTTALVGVVVLSLVTGTAVAQSAPDAGQLIQNQGRKPATLPKRGEGQDLAGQPATLAVPSGATVRVKSFAFKGNTLLTDAQLQRTLTGYTDRQLDFKELQEATALVAKRYTASGRLARVFLPAQDVTSGVVTLQIIEALYGGTRVEQSGEHVGAERARAMLEQGQVQGEALDLVALDRALLLVGDLPGVQAGASLVPGRNAGETAVALLLRDKPTVVGEVGVDNSGTRSTGEARVNASVALQGALGMGDLFTAQLNQNRGSSFVRLGASVPVGLQGARLGVSGNSLRYKLIGSDFAALQAKGSSSAVGLEGSYPVIRSRDRNLLLQGGVERKSFNNKANGAVFSKYKSRNSSFGLSGNLYDDVGGGGSTAGYLGAQFGRVDLSDSPSLLADQLGAKTNGSFRKVRYQLSRQQALGGAWSAYASLSGQWANRNLDSSERFYLGGPQGVRAYPISEGGGAIGQLGSLELRTQLGEGWRAAGFVDWGHVKVHVDENFLGATNPNSYSLKGAGLTVGYAGSGGLDVSLIWARRIGDNPLADARGRDLDGSLQRNRFWLQASQSF
jgi:hemolysin activation/secretion protein